MSSKSLDWLSTFYWPTQFHSFFVLRAQAVWPCDNFLPLFTSFASFDTFLNLFTIFAIFYMFLDHFWQIFTMIDQLYNFLSLLTIFFCQLAIFYQFFLTFFTELLVGQKTWRRGGADEYHLLGVRISTICWCLMVGIYDLPPYPCTGL